VICAHPQHDAIMDRLKRKRRLGLVAYYARVEKMDLVRHCQHEPIVVSEGHAENGGGEGLTTEPAPCSPLEVMAPAAPYIYQAVRLVGDDRDGQQALIEKLNQWLRDASMGMDT